MRGLISMITFALLARPVGAEVERYSAFVQSHDTPVFSGPDDEFYVTELLPAGTPVEVYRHDNQHWAAIRPTPNSFSLLPSTAVTMDADSDLARVAEPEVNTRIGSSVGGHFESEYLTLQLNELVEPIGLVHFDGESFVKILPPAGEFRWIRLADLKRTPPVPAESNVGMKPSPRSTQIQNPVEPIASLPESETSDKVLAIPEEPMDVLLVKPEFDEDKSFQESSSGIALVQAEADASDELSLLEPPPLSMSPSSPEDARAPSLSAGDSTNGTSGLVEPPSDAIASPDNGIPQPLNPPPMLVETGPQSTESDVRAVPTRSRTARLPRRPLGPMGRRRLAMELVEIEMELTQQLAMPPETWRFEDLRSRAAALIDTSDDAAQRFQSQQVLAKIAQYDDLRRRQQTMMADLPQRFRSSDTILAFDNPEEAFAESRYNGYGWLMPVITQRDDIPRYVLTDEDGNIKQFVSPRPGLNLKRFEQQRVGIYGHEGQLPTYNEPHLVAERIVTMEKTR